MCLIYMHHPSIWWLPLFDSPLSLSFSLHFPHSSFTTYPDNFGPFSSYCPLILFSHPQFLFTLTVVGKRVSVTNEQNHFKSREWKCLQLKYALPLLKYRFFILSVSLSLPLYSTISGYNSHRRMGMQERERGEYGEERMEMFRDGLWFRLNLLSRIWVETFHDSIGPCHCNDAIGESSGWSLIHEGNNFSPSSSDSVSKITFSSATHCSKLVFTKSAH